MARESLAEAETDTVEHITDANIDSTANVADPTKPHDATIPEPERDPTKPDDPTAQHESADHERAAHHHAGTRHAPGQAPGGNVGDDFQASNDQEAPGGARHKGHDRAAGPGINQTAGDPGQADAKGEGRKGPRIDPEDHVKAVDYFQKSLEKTDWAWDKKQGAAREIGHQSVIQMERAFLLVAAGDRKTASDMYQKHAGRPPSEALLKRVGEMSDTNFKEGLADLNHGINKLGVRQRHQKIHADLDEHRGHKDKWRRGMLEHAREEDGHFSNATKPIKQVVDQSKDPHRDHEHGQFLVKAAWKGMFAGGDYRKGLVAKFRKIKARREYNVTHRQVKKLEKAAKRFGKHTASGNPLDPAMGKGKAYTVNANDNEKGPPATPKATKGMTGRAFTKFKGVTATVGKAQTAMNVAKAAGKIVKKSVDNVKTAFGKVLDAVTIDAAKPQPGEQDQPQRKPVGKASDGLSSAIADKVEKAAPSAADLARNAARNAAQHQGIGMGQGM